VSFNAFKEEQADAASLTLSLWLPWIFSHTIHR
jgi:hypothetical protein